MTQETLNKAMAIHNELSDAHDRARMLKSLLPTDDVKCTYFLELKCVRQQKGDIITDRSFNFTSHEMGIEYINSEIKKCHEKIEFLNDKLSRL